MHENLVLDPTLRTKSLWFVCLTTTLTERESEIHTDGEKEGNKIELNIERNTDRVTEIQREREMNRWRDGESTVDRL